MSRPLAAIFSLSTFLNTFLFLSTFLITFPRAALGQSAQPASADSQAQTQASATKPPAFDIADVEISAPRRFPYKSGGDVRGGRYVLRDATLTDLISAAYGLDADNVLGGPSWLDTDRFDVIAKTQPVASPDALKLMLQSLLADRFKLVVHPDSKPLQVYVLSANGKPKFRESSGSGSGSCQPNPPPPPGSVPQISVTCHGITMEALAGALHDMAGGPAITVPSGFTPEQLPTGVTFQGRPYSDATVIALAYAYEQATRHRVPPSTTPPLGK